MGAISRIIIVFAAMLVSARLRCPLGISLVAGGIALNLWAGIGMLQTAANLKQSILSPELWLLLVVTALIIEIARFMTADGNAEEILSATQRWGGRHGRTASLAALPAMIGLVPMPAGALFSAPFVEQAVRHLNHSSGWKSAVNYWFRHVWEYWWPLYPGVIVTMAVFEIDAWRFVAAQFPFSVVAIGSGFLFLILPHVSELSRSNEVSEGSSRRAAFLFLPLLIVVVSVFVTPAVLQRLDPELSVQMRKLLSLLCGLIVAVAIVLRDEIAGHRSGKITGGSRMFSTLFKKKSLSVLVTLTGVLVFKSLLMSSGQLPVASREIVASGVPLAVTVAVLPFLAGFVTGIALGFSGVSFPLVVGLMATEGSGLTPIATLVLAFGFGYMGMMLSPVHLCLLVTRDYFGASLVRIYRHLAPCVLAVLAFSLAAYKLFDALGW